MKSFVSVKIGATTLGITTLSMTMITKQDAECRQVECRTVDCLYVKCCSSLKSGENVKKQLQVYFQKLERSWSMGRTFYIIKRHTLFVIVTNFSKKFRKQTNKNWVYIHSHFQQIWPFHITGKNNEICFIGSTFTVYCVQLFWSTYTHSCWQADPFHNCATFFPTALKWSSLENE